ncbi:hypothetical protein EDB80DRAFT_582491, partial [Ilyonectria destructans]
YINSKRGIEKSYIIYTIKNIFRLKGSLYILLIIDTSRNIAIFISRVTLYLVYNIRFKNKIEIIRNILEEEKLY